MCKIAGSIDFVVTYDSFVILVGWLETGEKTDERIFLHCSEAINIMPEKSSWYFREDVNESIKKQDDIKRGFFLTFPGHALRNKEFVFTVQKKGEDLLRKRISAENVKDLNSLPDQAAGFIRQKVTEPATKDYTFNERIEFIADRFFWCNPSIFIVSGAVDSSGYDRKGNRFRFIFGNLCLSPLDMIFLERNRVDSNSGEEKRILDEYLLIFESPPDAVAADCKTAQLQLQNEHNFGYVTLHTENGVSDKEKSGHLLSYLDPDSSHLISIFTKGLGLALDGVWEKAYSYHDIKIELYTYGSLPEKPKISMIVPLYGRIDFVMHQLAAFTNDFDFLKNVELIYVLDDPKQYDTIRWYMDAQYRIYRVPFRLVRYDKNLGYAKANNIGAGYSNADILVLMNSDVIPKTKKWVCKCIDLVEELENFGAVGIKLLYEDDSIQHQGMMFKRMPFLDNAWANIHPGKNMSDTGQSQKVVAVPAVTGAFLMTPKTVYSALGGLDEGYILGDFEDSDYCLKCYEKELLTYYVPQIEMYHLERQSQSMVEGRNAATMYNCWRHTHHWNDTIEKVMKRYRDGM